MENQSVQDYMQQLGRQARAASRLASSADSGLRDMALLAVATALEDSAGTLAVENARDLDSGREHGLEPALLDRLELTPERIAGMAEAGHMRALWK